MKHRIGHSNEDHGFAAFGQRFIVFGESSIFAEPGERAFDNPSFRQNHESTDCVTLDDLDESAMPPANPVHKLSGISLIGKNQSQSTKAGPQLLNDQSATVAVLNVGWMDYQCHDQTQRVYDQMPLAALDFLARVVPTIPPFSAVLTDWLSRMPTLGVGFLPAFVRTRARRRS